MATPTYTTRFPRVVRKADVDARAMSVSAVLTYPGVDLAGDVVWPSGIDFASHRRDPWIDLEHDGNRVGWARPSLDRPGDYGVSWKSLPIDGTYHRLPVGTTHFDHRDRLGSQVFALIAEDALPGVSLEFRPVPGYLKALGRSPLENRSAYEFFKADVVRWTHCARPVNEGALTLTKSQTEPDKLLSILSAGRVGSEQLHPTILKSLARYIPTPNKRTVRVEKAMDEDDPTTMYDDEAPEEAGEPAADEGTGAPTVQAHYDCSQGIIDLCDQAEQQLQASEHLKGKQYLLKQIEKLRSVAEDMKANGDKIDGELSGGTDETDEEPTGEEIETDEEGVIKGIRPVYRKAIKRFTLREVNKAATEHDPKKIKALTAAVKRLARQLS